MANSDPLTGLEYDDDHVLCATTLRFAVGDKPSGADPARDARRLIAAEDSALERRAGQGPDVEELEISFVYSSSENRYRTMFNSSAGYAIEHGHAEDITPARVAEWLRFAARRVTGRLTVAVPAAPNRSFDEQEAKRKFVAELPAYARAETARLILGDASATVPTSVPQETVNEHDETKKRKRAAELPASKTVDEHERKMKRKLVAELLLPASAKAEVMRLVLANARLTVPGPAAATGAFDALTDLQLSHARIEPGSAYERNLDRLLSVSCCPRLEHVQGLAALCVDAAGTLEELSLERLFDMTSLELDAPGLRVLRIVGCGRMLIREASARISAPRLEELACGGLCLSLDAELELLGSARARKGSAGLWLGPE